MLFVDYREWTKGQGKGLIWGNWGGGCERKEELYASVLRSSLFFFSGCLKWWFRLLLDLYGCLKVRVRDWWMERGEDGGASRRWFFALTCSLTYRNLTVEEKMEALQVMLRTILFLGMDQLQVMRRLFFLKHFYLVLLLFIFKVKDWWFFFCTYFSFFNFYLILPL